MRLTGRSQIDMLFCQAEDGIRYSSVTGVQTCALFIQAEDGIRDSSVTGVQTCALPICDSQPGEAVQVYVNDSVGNPWNETDDVTADANGMIADDVTLPDTFIANYSVTA